jgi:hypothetical protein
MIRYSCRCCVGVRAFITAAGAGHINLEYYHIEHFFMLKFSRIEIIAFITVAITENGKLQHFHIEILCNCYTFGHP